MPFQIPRRWREHSRSPARRICRPSPNRAFGRGCYAVAMKRLSILLIALCLPACADMQRAGPARSARSTVVAEPVLQGEFDNHEQVWLAREAAPTRLRRRRRRQDRAVAGGMVDLARSPRCHPTARSHLGDAQEHFAGREDPVDPAQRAGRSPRCDSQVRCATVDATRCVHLARLAFRRRLEGAGGRRRVHGARSGRRGTSRIAPFGSRA